MSIINLKNIFNISGTGIVLFSKVINGPVKMGMSSKISYLEIEITSILRDKQKTDIANTDDEIGINIKIKNPSEESSFFKKLFSGDKDFNELKKSLGTNIVFT